MTNARRERPALACPPEEDIWLGQLARAAQAGDRGARDALWLAVGPRLMRIADRTAWAFPALERDDAVQESFPIFAALVATWPGPETDGAGFATYLFGMFRWRLHSLLRAYERRRPATTEDFGANTERMTAAPPRAYAPVAWHEYGVDFPAFVARLPDHEREIFFLRIEEGLGTGDNRRPPRSDAADRYPPLECHPSPLARAGTAGSPPSLTAPRAPALPLQWERGECPSIGTIPPMTLAEALRRVTSLPPQRGRGRAADR